jgi:predicted lipid-binding transport protein (Tim44 family)
MAFLDLILLAALAAFLGYRLWLVLGTHEKDKPIRKRRSAEDDNVVPVRPQSFSEKTAQKPETQTASKDIDEDRFLQGAETAFRKIVQAYALGERAVLQKLLEGPLLETFEEAIEKRKKAKTSLEVEISRIVTSEILTQREEKGIGYVTVRFVSEQCLVTRDSKGKVLEGDPDRFTEVTDIWTFSRKLKSSDPNWKLVATQVPEA